MPRSVFHAVFFALMKAIAASFPFDSRHSLLLPREPTANDF